MGISTLKEEVDDEDRSKRNEEVRRDDGDDEEGAADHRDEVTYLYICILYIYIFVYFKRPDHRNAAQKGSQLLRDLWVNHVDVRREPIQDYTSDKIWKIGKWTC